MKNKSLIKLNKVVKCFKTQAGDFMALKGIDLEIEKGEFVAIIGKSGSGKSTLLNMVTGIDHPTGGRVVIDGMDVHGMNENQMAKFRGKHIGIVFQFFQLLPTLTVIENIMLPMDFCNMYSPDKRQQKAMDLLKLVNLEAHAHKLPSMLSGGQQQRIAIARALANDPPILVADEPTGNLDSKTAEHIFEIFETLIKRGKTILMVTHDSDQAKRVKRTVIISDGEIVNQWLSKVLPSLTPQLLAKVTKQLKPQVYTPGKVIIEQGGPADSFYVIAKGNAHVYLRQKDSRDVFVDVLKPGNYFDEMALINGGKKTATVRAARDSEVEVAVLSKKKFLRLVDDSSKVKQAIETMIEKRSKNQAKLNDS